MVGPHAELVWSRGPGKLLDRRARLWVLVLGRGAHTCGPRRGGTFGWHRRGRTGWR